jgi:hypothetical protein
MLNRATEATRELNRGRHRRWGGTGLASVMFAGVLMFVSTGASWSQGRIGNAPIIVNSVQGNLVSGSSGPVAQGDSVYRDENIRTLVDSKAGLVLEDQSNVTIGPSSNVKLDRFIYPGPQRLGTVILNLAKGTCRISIGDANKRSYTIMTPTAVLGVRG